MKKILRFLTILFSTCMGIGFIVSKIESLLGKTGWVDEHKPYGPYEKHFKRPLDFGLSLFTLLLFWPILVIIAIAVRINMGSPIIFTQERPGLGGNIFKIYKFRTMTDEKDSSGNLLSDEERLTKFGKLLRSTSGDEFPELFNILNGDMSIIGPRPLLIEYLTRYNENQKHRHDVRPGLTGYAQANGRNSISWEEKFENDVWYVYHISFFNDLKIIFKTVSIVFNRKGINSKTSATMEKFIGTNI